jgi:hypothetical protein
MNDPDDSKKLKQLGPEITFGDDSLNPSVVDLPYAYDQDRNKSTRSTANDVFGSSGGIEMTSFRRPSAAAASERERFRRFSQLSSSGARPEVESQQIPSIRESIARIEEEPTGADAIDRGTVDGGFGWVIVACRSEKSYAVIIDCQLMSRSCRYLHHRLPLSGILVQLGCDPIGPPRTGSG